jgi:hypothetical protein
MTKTFVPQEVTDAESVFGGGSLIPYGDWKGNDFIPSKKDIPEEFREWRGTQWNEVASTWFYSGLDGYTFKMKKGIDETIAMKHLQIILRSWTPKHEHKIAAVAYLMSEWFEWAKDAKNRKVAP